MSQDPQGAGNHLPLYACLNRLNTPDVNIITVEDPVEFDIEGITQIQINTRAGITFAAGLRSILRQDPDIVMVGEIRDPETASIACQAAQTGHLVFSTLHTNDAVSTLTRLMDLGIEPFMISSSLLAVVGQRLVRNICPECRIPDPMSPQVLEKLPPHFLKQKDIFFWKGAGCEACGYSGYSGRSGLYEILNMSPSIKEAINSPDMERRIRKALDESGFQYMSMDGIGKAIRGLTTIDEIFRVAPPEIPEIQDDIKMQAPLKEEIFTGKIEDEDMVSSLSPIRPQKILLADDNDMIIKILSSILESEGYLTITAKNGMEALKLALQERPDLIITDFLMPVMDGVTLIKKIKSQLATRYIPIIMLTAKGEEDAEIEGIDAGADDYITKPVNSRRLMVRIKRLLKRPSVE